MTWLLCGRENGIRWKDDELRIQVFDECRMRRGIAGVRAGRENRFPYGQGCDRIQRRGGQSLCVHPYSRPAQYRQGPAPGIRRRTVQEYRPGGERYYHERQQEWRKTWSRPRAIAKAHGATFNNPCPVYDARTKTVTVVFQRYPAGVKERQPNIPDGWDDEKCIRNFMIQSRNGGSSWTKPQEITKTTKRPSGVDIMASGPNAGTVEERRPQGPPGDSDE